MTAVRRLEIEDEFIEINLRALPAEFFSGQGDF
jgi:hypothetical protein